MPLVYSAVMPSRNFIKISYKRNYILPKMHFDNQYDQYINKINIQIHRRIEELCHTANTQLKYFALCFFSLQAGCSCLLCQSGSVFNSIRCSGNLLPHSATFCFQLSFEALVNLFVVLVRVCDGFVLNSSSI